MQVSKENRDILGAKNNEHIKSRSEAIQKLVKQKQEQKEHALKKEKLKMEAKEKSKNSFRIPKKKPEVEILINSLFDDTDISNNDVSDTKVSGHKVEHDSSDVKNSSSSSHKDKHLQHSDYNLLKKGKDTENIKEKSSSSVHSHQNHKSHTSPHKSPSSSSKQADSNSGSHKSSSSSSKQADSNSGSQKSLSSASSDQKHKSSSSSDKSNSKSRDSDRSGKESSSATKDSLSSKDSFVKKDSFGKESSAKKDSSEKDSSSAKKDSSGTKQSSSHSSSSKSNSLLSSKQKESSSKPDSASSKSKLNQSSDFNKTDEGSSLPKQMSPKPSSADQQPIVLNKHHLNPIVERQASAGLSEKEKILARLQAIKQRTLEAIHKENSAKGRRVKGEKTQRKSKSEVTKHDDKTKSVEIVKDIVSSDEEEEKEISGVPSALDIMLSERNAKLEKEKIARLAKQAWERATKKDAGDSDDTAKVKKKYKSSKRDKETNDKHIKLKKDRSRSNDRKKDRSISPHEPRKPSPKPKKPVVIKRAHQTGAPPIDFKALLAMAEKKQSEPPKLFTAIPKKKKEEESRPLTQEEKDRIERKKSKEYQDWLKFGGKAPSQNNASDEEEQSTHSLENNDKKHVNSTSTVKHKTLSGSSKQSFNVNSSGSNKEHPRQQNAVTVNGNSKPRNITVNENVLVCGPAVSSDEEGSPDRSANPFDRIMSKFHKKRPAPSSQSGIPAKRNHFDDSEEDEYDSEMDDFIDDGNDNEPDYSKEIKNLFGYDKNKYKYENDDDLSDMEADYSTVMREEKRSAKIGLMEDLEDMRMEQEELKRKALSKKRK